MALGERDTDEKDRKWMAFSVAVQYAEVLLFLPETGEATALPPQFPVSAPQCYHNSHTFWHTETWSKAHKVHDLKLPRLYWS